jgi:hypothetical protein
MIPAWQHATIAFQPYPDVGEFVNVGVLALAVPGRVLAYRLLPARATARIQGFFPELNPAIYREGRASLQAELERIENAVNAPPVPAGPGPSPSSSDARQGVFDLEEGNAETLFRALTAPRDGLFRFHPRGAILSTDAVSALDTLFERYVTRTKPDAHVPGQAQLTREVEKWLGEWQLRHLYRKDVRVGTEAFHVKFPFGYQPQEEEAPRRVIKPLNLSGFNSTEIYHYGDGWVASFNRLYRMEKLPAGVLLPVKMPLANRGAAHTSIKAAEEIVRQLEELNVTVTDAEDRSRIREFAQIQAEDLVLRA